MDRTLHLMVHELQLGLSCLQLVGVWAGHDLRLGYRLRKATSELQVRERQFGKIPPGTYKSSGLHLISNFKTSSQPSSIETHSSLLGTVTLSIGLGRDILQQVFKPALIRVKQSPSFSRVVLTLAHLTV